MFLLSSKLVNISRTICIFNRAHLLSFPPFSSGPIFDAGSTCPWQFSRLPLSSPLHILIYRYIYMEKPGRLEKWFLCHISVPYLASRAIYFRQRASYFPISTYHPPRAWKVVCIWKSLFLWGYDTFAELTKEVR